MLNFFFREPTECKIWIIKGFAQNFVMFDPLDPPLDPLLDPLLDSPGYRPIVTTQATSN